MLLEVCQQSTKAASARMKENTSQIVYGVMDACFIATNTDVMATMQSLQDTIWSQQEKINIFKSAVSVNYGSLT